MNNFAEILIAEVQKRECLWNKTHEHYNNRTLVDKEWTNLAYAMNRDKEHIKMKWRNLRDQFQRELKKVPRLPNGDLAEYTGNWCNFEHCFFLRDVVQSRWTTIHQDSLNYTANSNDSNGRYSPEGSNHGDEIEEMIETYDIKPVIEHRDVTFVSCADTRKRRPSSVEDVRRDRNATEKRPRVSVDDDMHFVMSLVPFLKRLTPMRKLIVRNAMQTMLIKEFLCEQCRTAGQRPYCKCMDND